MKKIALIALCTLSVCSYSLANATNNQHTRVHNTQSTWAEPGIENHSQNTWRLTDTNCDGIFPYTILPLSDSYENPIYDEDLFENETCYADYTNEWDDFGTVTVRSTVSGPIYSTAGSFYPSWDHNGVVIYDEDENVTSK